MSDRNYILFSERKKLGEMYLDWVETNGVLDCPSSLIAFLHIKGLLDIGKVVEYLNSNTESEDTE